MWRKALIVAPMVGLVLFQHTIYQTVGTIHLKGSPQDSTNVSLLPGELPGYTGWARPQKTLVGYFFLQNEPRQKKHTLSMTVACSHKDCLKGGAHFYVRAYGRTVIVGRVQDNRDGTYDIILPATDPGTYNLEVVLTTSYAVLEDFPMSPEGPAYEGFLLPGFPMKITIEGKNIKEQSKDLCTMDQLLYKESQVSRWMVMDRVTRYREVPSPQISLAGYQSGHNSLGIFMDYVPTDCSFVPQYTLETSRFAKVVDTCSSYNEDPIHIIFVGDSVSLMQQRQMQASLKGVSSNIRTTRVSTSGGIRKMLEEVMQELNEIALLQERRFVLFNTGLHDVAQLCGEKYRAARTKYIDNPETSYRCVADYGLQLQKLADFIEAYPAELKVFQTTSAGWMRYGNYGFAWPPHQEQNFSMSPNMVKRFNEVALSIVQQYRSIKVMDAYWMSLARPDNREINIENAIGKHLVHPGVEVLDAMGRIWWMIVLRHLCGSELDIAYVLSYF